jgi:hypothetical protein
MSKIRDSSIYQWLRQKTVLALDIPLKAFDDHFTESSEALDCCNELDKYLSNENGIGSSIYFACTKSTKEIEGIKNLNY